MCTSKALYPFERVFIFHSAVEGILRKQPKVFFYLCVLSVFGKVEKKIDYRFLDKL